MKKIIKRINQEIENKRNECWGYHKDIIKESGFTKSDIGELDVDAHDWEDVAFFEGVIYGLTLTKEMIEEEKVCKHSFDLDIKKVVCSRCGLEGKINE